MARIILRGYIEVPVDDIDAVERELEEHIRLTRAETGCLVFRVVQDAAKRSRFHVYEEFVDRASFTQHQERVQASTWGKVTASVTRHYEICEEPE